MRKIKKEEIQPLETDILFKLLDFMEANHIRYFTCGGTTLGSVRHGGFIPWDDDIDLFVPRSDYERLLQLSAGKLLDGYISVKRPGDANYIYPFAKACNEKTVIHEQNVKNQKYAIGIFVDIFPLDTFCDNALLRRHFLLRIKCLRSMLEAASDQINLSSRGSAKWWVKQTVRTLQRPAAKAIGVERLALRIDALAKRANRSGSHLVGNQVWCYKWNDYYNADYFASAVNGTFEGRTICNPAGYHQYLTELYGDYMQLPPKEQQIMHGFDGYYLEEDEGEKV